MEERLEQRLKTLKAEFETGQRMLADLEAKRAELERTLLRISGAIQVLEEELGQRAPEPLSQNGHEV
jgi:predicted nuclease with TOPRIM domain